MTLRHINNRVSRIYGTYENVAYIRRDTGDTVHLLGEDKNSHRLDNSYFIACIHLGESESLERVDLPRD
jgi:hypothetical protein